MVKSVISGQNRDSVSVPNRGGTGTKQGWYRYQTGVVPVPLMQRQNGTSTIKVVPVSLTITKVVPIPRQSGTGTNFQNMIGIDTNPSGTGTTAFGSPDFCICALLSSNSHTEGIGTLINE